jgi:hypothetical protein
METITNLPKVEEVYKIIGTYELYIKELEPKLKVKVVQYPTGKYMGMTNLEVKGKECGDFYRSLRICETESDALRDAVQGFLTFYSKEAKTRVVDDW